MVQNIATSLVIVILLNMATGVVPKMVMIFYTLIKETWYIYKTGQYKCKPKKIERKKSSKLMYEVA